MIAALQYRPVARSLTGLLVVFLLAASLPAHNALFGQAPPAFKQKSSQKSGLRDSLRGSGFGASLGSSSPANANEPVTVSAKYQVHLESRTGVLNVTAKIDDTWHIYSTKKIEGGPISSKISLGDTAAVQLAGKFKPDHKPHVIDDGLFDNPREEFEGTVTWSVPIRFKPDADLKQTKLPIKFFYQACANACLPPTTAKTKAKFAGELDQAVKLTAQSESTNETTGDTEPKEHVVTAKIDKPVVDSDEVAEMAKLYDAEKKINYVPLKEIVKSADGSQPDSATNTTKTTLVTALLGAFVGGFLLNLMPCVFPVLGIKVLGFVEQAGSSPMKIRLHGLAFTAGLVASMWVLGGFILYVKSTSDGVNWGQQMGSPYFVGGIIVLLFLMGLNLAGVFEFGTSMTRLGGVVQQKKGYGGSFWSGVLTTLIATPCSGPFLGAAMGYTLAQETGVAMLLFTVLALGIALPYLVLSMFPSLISVLPRPGAWMETFKVSMAFLVFAAAAFFMRTFGAQTGVEGLTLLIMALVVLGLAAYFYGHWSQPHRSLKTRRVWGMGMPLLIAGAAMWMTYSAASNLNNSVEHGEFRPWAPGIVEYQTSRKNRPVLVDYTAEWCATCQVNERLVFPNQEVRDRLTELGVLLVAADMTLTDDSAEIMADLARADRNTISTYLIYPANYPQKPAILLEELITANDVLTALDLIDPAGPKSEQQTDGNGSKPQQTAARQVSAIVDSH